MKILVLSHEYPPIGGGGARAIEDLCRGLTRRGHEIQILTTHFGDLPRVETLEGVKIFRLPCGRRVLYRARLSEMGRYVMGGFWAGLSLIRKWQPHVIHVHFAVPAEALGWALSRLTGLPYIITTQLGDVPGGAPQKTAAWFRWIFPFTPPIWRSAAAVVAVSEFTRRLVLRHYPVEVRIIPNGFDLSSAPQRERRTGEPPRIVWAGRFAAEKNPLKIVSTLAQLNDLPWQCVLIGDGQEKAHVAQAITRAGLDERFTLPGWLPQEEVMNWFARSDILFMPSLAEGLPLVGVQALASGLAIVASHIGGFIDLVEAGRNGFLVADPLGDGFVEPLRVLLSDGARLQAFQEASRRLAGRFDLQAVVQAYEQLFRDEHNDTGRP